MPWPSSKISIHFPFERTSKRRKGFPSETQVKRGHRVVGGEKYLVEKLGRNDLCPCGSGRRFQEVLFAGETVRGLCPGRLLLDEVPMAPEFCSHANRPLAGRCFNCESAGPTNNELINRKRGITPSTALRLAKFFGNSAGFWMNVQLRWELYHAQRSEEESLRGIRKIKPRLSSNSVDAGARSASWPPLTEAYGERSICSVNFYSGITLERKLGLPGSLAACRFSLVLSSPYAH